MIDVTIDEKACVGCTLCTEVCATGVLAFDEDEGVPEVVKPRECFGCLSCSEICPAGAVDHQGVLLSQSHYHDPYALRLASRLASASGDRFQVPEDAESWEQGLQDLGIRLLSVAEVFRRTIGGGLPAVGTMAGRTLAGRLQRYRAPHSLSEALDLTRRQFAPAWVIDAAVDDGDLTIAVGDCFVRQVCTREGIALGGDLCTLFYHYLAGYVGRMGRARLRLLHAEPGGERCVYQVRIHE